MSIDALILAAGKGSRMQSETPKTLVQLLNKPMILHIIDAALNSRMIHHAFVVLGYKREMVEAVINHKATCLVQAEQRGTADAVLKAEGAMKSDDVIILLGDMPLITTAIIDHVIEVHRNQEHTLTVLSVDQENPDGYGRIIRDTSNQVMKIVEDRDCTPQQKRITEVNTGVFVVKRDALFEAAKQVKPSEKNGEYSITDIVEILSSTSQVGVVRSNDSNALRGVNTVSQLLAAELRLKERIVEEHIKNGVNIAPNHVSIGADVSIERGATLLANTRLGGHTSIGKNVVVGPDASVEQSTLHNHVRVIRSVIRHTVLGEHTSVGPFSYVHDQTTIGPHNKIGNFVEMRSTSTGAKVRIGNHVRLLDTTIGSNTAIEEGTLVIGEVKAFAHTVIGNHVKIGAHCVIKAGVHIGDGVYVEDGSRIDMDIPSPNGNGTS